MSIALIVGAGRPLTEALVTAFLERFDTVVLTTRSLAGGADFAAGKEARIIQCDATRAAEVADLFGKVDELGEPLEVATYLPSAGFRGSITALPAHAASNAMEVSAGGAFMIAREAAKRMVPQRRGALFFVGATASSKGFAKSAPFAMGKFALRGLTQSLARELHPKNVHVSHIVVDGMIEGIRPVSQHLTSISAPNSMARVRRCD